jgi:predicted nucleic acid-binding protein
MIVNVVYSIVADTNVLVSSVVSAFGFSALILDL